MPTRNENRYLEDDWGGETRVQPASRTAELDRRNTHRVALKAGVTYVVEGGGGDRSSGANGQLIELSREGCRIEGSHPVVAGDSLTLSIKFSDGHPALSLSGVKVCWIEGYKFGVKFAKLTDNQRQQYKTWYGNSRAKRPKTRVQDLDSHKTKVHAACSAGSSNNV
jgi:PilZ domain-containing protein